MIKSYQEQFITASEWDSCYASNVLQNEKLSEVKSFEIWNLHADPTPFKTPDKED